MCSVRKKPNFGLVRALSGRLAREGIRLGAVCPGLVDTPLTAGARTHFQAAGVLMLSADEVAAAVVDTPRTGEAGTELVLTPGHGAARYVPTPLR